MQLSTLPHLSHALALLAVDMGAILCQEAEFPPKWVDRAAEANLELSKLSPDLVEQLVLGEEMDQEQLRPQAVKAHELLLDAFDGDLGDLLFTSLRNGRDYLTVEDVLDTLTRGKLELQKQGA